MKQRPRKITHSVINPKLICNSTLFPSKVYFNNVNIWNVWGHLTKIQELYKCKPLVSKDEIYSAIYERITKNRFAWSFHLTN